MAGKIAAAALQYSKWLSRFICWVWAIYRFLVIVLSTIQPEASPALVTTVTGIDTIMLVNVGTYLVNSLGEKYIYSDRFILTWMKSGGWKSLVNKVSGLTKDSDEESEESNG